MQLLSRATAAVAVSMERSVISALRLVHSLKIPVLSFSKPTVCCLPMEQWSAVSTRKGWVPDVADLTWMTARHLNVTDLAERVELAVVLPKAETAASDY